MKISFNNFSGLLFFLRKAFFLLLLTGFLSPVNLKAQDESENGTVPLFQSDEPLDIILKADLNTVFHVKDDSTWFPALLSLKDNSGKERTIEINIRTRGKTRREKDVCLFPPLRIKFPKKETKDTPFEGQRSIKLVTHCNKADNYEQNTIIEYLIYKVYNVLTDSSFKVRPAFISYVFSDKEDDTIRKYAFFIEREKYLADRLHGIEIENETIHPNRLESHNTCMMDMFQFMIGNTDYSIYKLHNIILVSDSTYSLAPFAVPYDFDWSGLVNAVYAVPHPMMRTEKVTQRVYRGFKKNPEIVFQTIQKFNTLKPDIYNVFINYKYLEDKERKQALAYLDEFYDIINRDKLVKKLFIDHARVVHD